MNSENYFDSMPLPELAAALEPIKRDRIPHYLSALLDAVADNVPVKRNELESAIRRYGEKKWDGKQDLRQHWVAAMAAKVSHGDALIIEEKSDTKALAEAIAKLAEAIKTLASVV